MSHKKFSEHFISVNMPIKGFQTVEEALAWFDHHSGKHCPDKIRMFLIESEGSVPEYGPWRNKPLTLDTSARSIAFYEYCMKDEFFATGWLERDGTCRSNCYTGHAQHLYTIKHEYAEAERRGWMHVSTDYATAYYEPTKKQVAVMDRLGYPWNSSSTLPKWRAPRKNATVAEQVSEMSAMLQSL